MFHCPFLIVYKKPTANSAQIRKRNASRAIQEAIWYLVLLIFLIANSHMRPVPNNKNPAIAKSENVQLTSSKNCIAIKGTSNSIAEMSSIIKSLLFCFIVYLVKSLR